MSASSAREHEDILPIAALLLLGSFAFVNLLSLPAFEDEGTQLRWIFRLIHEGEWLPPLGAGKPLEAWLVAPLVRAGIPALLAARTMHVLAGMIGALLTYRLARHLGSRRTAFASAVLFVVCPFVVYLQRLALSDMFLCAAGLWVLASVLDFIRIPTVSRAGALAMALVLVAWCKFPVGFVFVGAVPLVLLLMPSGERRRLLERNATALACAQLPVILLAALVAVVAAIRWRHGQSLGFGLDDFAGIATGGYADIASVIGIPRSRLANELAAQLSWPVIAIASIGIVAAARFGGWRLRWLTAMGILPMFGIAFLARFWFSRYLLFTLPPLIVAAAYGWHALAQRTRRPSMQWLAWAVCVGFMGRQSALLVLAPANAQWSALDRFQYIDGPPSGYGYPQAAEFLMQAPRAPPSIYSLDGHSAYQLLCYLPAPWIERVKPVFYGDDGRLLDTQQARLAHVLEHTPAWVIISDQLREWYLDSELGSSASAQIRLRPVARFDKPGSRSQLAIYEIRGVR
jgi:4-amino-4-deoxy-L-arabinose transferase-like glycosyltransferase